MISVNQLIKIGRQKLILEITDHLQVNDFFNESGYQHSTIHGKYSRFKLTLVDTKKGKKDNSYVLNYNFTVNEFRKLGKILGIVDTYSYVESICTKLTPELYQKNSQYFNKLNGKDLDSLSSIKINHYKKDNQDKSPVTKIALTYESAMRNDSKWKIYIEEGTGIAQKDGNFFKLKPGTYSKTKSSFINITREELIELVAVPIHYLNRWEQNHQLEFEKNRSNFLKRFKDSNYDEMTIKDWNMSPATKNSKINNKNHSDNNTQSKPQEPQQNENLGGKICSHCGNTVDENVAKYSQRTFKKVLCRDCQQEYRNQSTNNNQSIQDKNTCCDCKKTIKNKSVVDYSIRVYGKTLCMDCQKKNKKIS